MESNQQHQELLQKYAEAIVRVGLNLRAGQRLIITNATARGVPPAGRPLVHAVTKAAYAAGARFVDVIWGDEEMLRLRAYEKLQNLVARGMVKKEQKKYKGIPKQLANLEIIPPKAPAPAAA